MGKGGIVFYFWEADATEKGSLGPNTVVNSNQKNLVRAADALRTQLDGGPPGDSSDESFAETSSSKCR